MKKERERGFAMENEEKKGRGKKGQGRRRVVEGGARGWWLSIAQKGNEVELAALSLMRAARDLER